MKSPILLIALVASLVASGARAEHPQEKGTILCAFCNYVVTEIDDFLTSAETEDDVIEFVEQICNIFEGISHDIAQACKIFIEENGPIIIEDLVDNNLSPDIICIDSLHACEPTNGTLIHTQ
eukprot:maker-scaffold541_size141817-snap-gene-0.32 protein:Tk05607 transcript:maker-scaffold541_size141817-snap-gene-0.32-mRNA-1 annotation:"predicted protein"